MSKVCTKCGEEKPFIAFGFHPHGKNGLAARCKECKSDYAKQYVERKRTERNAYNQRWRESNPDKVLARRLRRNYNISLERYNEIMESQEWGCAICGLKNVSFVVDHDHSCCDSTQSCGQCVRGILCRKCNAGLGMFSDSADRIEKANKYLKERKL